MQLLIDYVYQILGFEVDNPPVKNPRRGNSPTWSFKGGFNPEEYI